MLWHLRGFFLTCQFGFAVHVPHLSGNSICLWQTVCAYCGLAEVWSGIILLVDSDLVVGTIDDGTSPSSGMLDVAKNECGIMHYLRSYPFPYLVLIQETLKMISSVLS